MSDYKLHIQKLRDRTLQHNTVAQIAHLDGRNHIVPGDVDESFKNNPVDKVRLDVLEILGEGGTGFSYEAGDVIAFVAFNGPERNEAS